MPVDASRGASTRVACHDPVVERFARLLSLGRSLKALEVRKREKAGVWPPIAARRAASPAGGAERADAGASAAARSIRTTPAQSQRRNETPRRTFRGQPRPSAAALRALREGPTWRARRWTCSDVSQKARLPPTEFRGSVLGEEGDVSVRNERGSSDRTDAGAAPGVVARGRAADVAETPDERRRAFDISGRSAPRASAESPTRLKDRRFVIRREARDLADRV